MKKNQSIGNNPTQYDDEDIVDGINYLEEELEIIAFSIHMIDTGLSRMQKMTLDFKEDSPSHARIKELSEKITHFKNSYASLCMTIMGEVIEYTEDNWEDGLEGRKGFKR